MVVVGVATVGSVAVGATRRVTEVDEGLTARVEVIGAMLSTGSGLVTAGAVVDGATTRVTKVDEGSLVTVGVIGAMLSTGSGLFTVGCVVDGATIRVTKVDEGSLVSAIVAGCRLGSSFGAVVGSGAEVGEDIVICSGAVNDVVGPGAEVGATIVICSGAENVVVGCPCVVETIVSGERRSFRMLSRVDGELCVGPLLDGAVLVGAICDSKLEELELGVVLEVITFVGASCDSKLDDSELGNIVCPVRFELTVGTIAGCVAADSARVSAVGKKKGVDVVAVTFVVDEVAGSGVGAVLSACKNRSGAVIVVVAEELGVLAVGTTARVGCGVVETWKDDCCDEPPDGAEAFDPGEGAKDGCSAAACSEAASAGCGPVPHVSLVNHHARPTPRPTPPAVPSILRDTKA